MAHDPRTSSAFDLSLSEISALCARATRGAGRSWGEAEEAAEAVCWLARAGLDWASALLGVLDLPADDAACPLRTGIALADHAGLPDAPSQASPQRHRLHYPCFVLPFAARMVAQTGQWAVLEWSGARVVLAPGAGPRLDGAILAPGREVVTIRPVAPDNAPCPDWPQTHHGAVSAAQYARLTALVMAFTVPTSARSLAGAGAQGDDND